MKVLLLCLLACTAAGTAAGLLILLLKKFFRDKLSPAWHCYVWLLMMVLLLVPVLVKPELPALSVLPQLPDFEQIPAETVENPAPILNVPTPQLPASNEYKVEIPLSLPPSTDSKTESQATMVEGMTLPPVMEYEEKRETAPSAPSLSTPLVSDPMADEFEELHSLPASWNFDIPDWIWGIFLSIWLGGALYILGDQWRSYRSFTSALKASTNEPEEEALLILQEVKEDLGIRRKIRLVESRLPISPMLVGLWRPTLYLPKERLNPRELSLIFVHELTHYRYHDLFYKELALLLRGLHWFNPLTWFMVEDIDFSCELCCDSRVRRHIGSENAKEYSALLLNLLRHEKVTAPVVSFSMDKASLKRRLSLIMKPKTTSKVLSILLTLLIAFGGVACSSSVAPELEEVKETLVTTEEKNETTAETPVSTSEEELAYELAWVSDDNIFSLERYLAANPRAQRWIDACNEEADRVFALAERVEENGKIYYQELICKGWFLPPNTYDCGSFVVNRKAVVGKEQKSLITATNSAQKGAFAYEIVI